MPGITGVELAIMLTRSIPDLKVLFFSGQASTVDVLEKARRGGHHFTALTKPVHPTDMLNRISECLATHKPIPLPQVRATKPPSRNQLKTPSTTALVGTGRRSCHFQTGAGIPPIPNFAQCHHASSKV